MYSVVLWAGKYCVVCGPVLVNSFASKALASQLCEHLNSR